MSTVELTAGAAVTDATRPHRVTWWVVTVLSTAVGAYALVLVATGFSAIPEPVASNGFPLGLYAHVSTAGFALLLGPLQFARRLRARAPRAHRWIGRGYVVACLAGGVSGAMIAVRTTSGPLAATGFFVLGVAWIACTTLGFAHARRRRFAAHQRWMIRSFALTFAAVTLRLHLGVTGVSGIEFDAAYPWIAWLCWAPNLLVAEWWLHRRAAVPRRRRARVATA